MTTTAPSVVYSIDYINKRIHHGLEYSLPSEIIHNLQRLQAELKIQPVAGTFVKRTFATTATTTRVKKPPRNREDLSWTTPKETFKATHFVSQNKSLSDTYLSDIRVFLNKISEKTFDKLKENIIDIYSKVEPENKLFVAEQIFDIASSNVFLSTMNAKLYGDLINVDDTFGKVLETRCQEYWKEFTEVENLSHPENTKEIDRRLSMTKFLVCLYLHDTLLSLENFMEKLSEWAERVMIWGQEPGRTSAVEELTEHLFWHLQQSYMRLSEQFPDKWDQMYEIISELSEKTVKDWPSLSNRAIFKYRDLMDTL
jgi:hypothetical protein